MENWLTNFGVQNGLEISPLHSPPSGAKRQKCVLEHNSAFKLSHDEEIAHGMTRLQF